MKNIFIYLIFLPLFLFSQNNFPINGVKKSSNKIHAFTNVDIYLNHQEKLKKATLIIKNDEMTSQIIELSNVSRVDEIASLISGTKITETARKVALDLLQN